MPIKCISTHQYLFKVFLMEIFFTMVGSLRYKYKAFSKKSSNKIFKKNKFDQKNFLLCNNYIFLRKRSELMLNFIKNVVVFYFAVITKIIAFKWVSLILSWIFYNISIWINHEEVCMYFVINLINLSNFLFI